ncbi:uncharacterized protein LOC62_06G008502 [Vanrija pseudolonga]|uniref:Uncharacterized protein n=1 Tax=Vanrija pseudolonga TaxID=143232 RepID=A0AAF0YI26_9TREE|nr:hypothetical protein LOC62_06G008502 [Vanrija pseudolonga]
MEHDRQPRSPSSTGFSSGLESAYSPRSGTSRHSHYSLSRTPTPSPPPPGGDDDDDDDDNDTPAQRLTRAEIGGYAALLSGLRERDASGLAQRLISGLPRWAHRSVSPEEEEDELVSSSAAPSSQPASPSTPARVSSAAPSVLFSPTASTSAASSAQPLDAATRWPLHPSELPPAPALGDALADAASRLVHRGALTLPRPPVGPIRTASKRKHVPEPASQDDLGVAPEVAQVVAQRVSMVLDRTLASLAAMQGVSLARDRKVMRWPVVLAAASMVADQRVVESATARLNAIFKADERADGELLRHRLDAAQDVRAASRADARDMLDTLYAVPPLAARPAKGRSHRKPEDVAAMTAKQEAREAKRQKKNELEDARRAAREARREAKRLKEKERLRKYHAK